MAIQQLMIQPVQKEEAAPEVRALFEDIQDTMGIPWPPAMWRVYANYPGVMRLFWERLKPAVDTQPFLLEALAITERAYRDVARWYLPNHSVVFRQEEQPRLQWELDAFEYGNPQLLIQQLALNRIFLGQVAGREGAAEPRRQSSQYRRPEIGMIDEQAASQEVLDIYQDIKQTLGLALVNSDYQAMAKWPEFFGPVWEDVKHWRGRREYRELVREIASKGEMAATRITPPVLLHQQEVRDALEGPGQFDNLRGIMEMFPCLLPELIASDALLRVATLDGQPLSPPRPEGAPAPGE